jgi:O-antigen/teichoic acid export membrane protein
MNNHSNKNLYKLTLYSGILKTVFTMITGIISVPLILNYFGTEKYGALNVITSYIAFLAMTNLGLNSGASILINKNTDFKTKITILKRAVIILFIILPVIIFLLCLIAYLNPNWINIFNFPNSIQNEAKIVTIIMIAFTFINLPFSLLSSALIGFQKNHIENLFSVLNLTFSILCTLAVIYLKKNFIFYAFLTNFIILIINIIKTLYFFKIKKSKFDSYSTLYENQSDTSYKVIAVTSYRCMLGAIAAMLVLNTDNIVIAKYIGIQHVTEFSITFKVYTIVFSLIYLFNSSIVPLLGKNINNREYLQKIYNNTLFTVIILGGLFWVGTVAFGKTLILLWAGENGYAGIFVLIYFLKRQFAKYSYYSMLYQHFFQGRLDIYLFFLLI